MNLSIQSHMMSNNNRVLTQRTTFKEKFLTPSAFAAEPEVIARIKKLPNNVFMDSIAFTKFCKSIDITPKISQAITKRLSEVWQAKASSKSFIG